MKDYFQGLTTDESREDRVMIRLFVARVLFWAAVLAGIALVTKAYSEEIPVHVLEDGQITLRLMPGPCTDAMSALVISNVVPQEYHARFKAIDSVWPEKDGSRKSYPGCWAEFSTSEAGSSEPIIFMTFSDGAYGTLPKSKFNKPPRGGRA